MGSYCKECDAVNEQLHKKTCFFYSREAKARDKEIKQLQDELKSLKEFGRFVIKDMCFGCDLLDGGDIQEVADKLGLIKPVEATEDDVDEESDFEVGDIIYKFTDTLKGGE